MKQIAIVLSVAAATAAVVPAQAVPPAPQLEKLDRLVGTWEGSGMATMAPGQPAGPWTSKSSLRWILGGHALREDISIDTGAPGQPILQMINITAWDADRQRLVSFGVSNTGGLDVASAAWTDDNTMVQITTGVEQGQPFADRWVTVLDGDTMRYTDHRSFGAAPPFVHVEGTSKKVSDKPSDIEAIDASFMAFGIEKKMERLAKSAGIYDVKGKWIPGPDAPATEIKGVETDSMVLGGTILQIEVDGQPGDYKALGFIGWNPTKECYLHGSVNNMGQVTIAQGHWVGDVFVTTAADQMQGAPTVVSGKMSYRADGSIKSVKSHMIMGTADPLLAFTATYTRHAK